MNDSSEIHRLESELESGKRDFREDANRINQKFQETRAQLSPANAVENNAMLFCAMGLVLGFLLGYLDVPVKEIGKPAARAVLTTAGKQAAVRAFRGNTV